MKTKYNKIPLWDELSELVYFLLRLFIPTLRNKVIIETGSGTGRISLRLAKCGGKVILLDISRNAIMYSKKLAREMNIDCDFIVGSIFYLPLREYSIDVVWSSGVLEHYEFNEQQKSINEALRVLKQNGRLIVIVPNRKAVIYNTFRVVAVKTARWKLGYEEPLSLEDLQRFQPKPIVCYSAGLLHQFRFVDLPIIGCFLNIILSFVYKIWPYLKELDKHATGYLLGALWIKSDP
ncbi:MAG: class I SAM-dependent methyltransferase [Candidatus Verstraetearchaeota archaeon]|nr:class I SAM-dependent methyltransferase [Candidatus Verstraetearchaeota archaeon]